jgi:hypothetical protein
MLPRFLDKGGWWRAWPTQDDCCEVMVSTAAGGQPTHEGLRNHAFQNRKRRRPANPLEAATAGLHLPILLESVRGGHHEHKALEQTRWGPRHGPLPGATTAGGDPVVLNGTRPPE